MQIANIDNDSCFLFAPTSRFLGYVNSIGTAFEAPTLATGLGGYIAQVQHHWGSVGGGGGGGGGGCWKEV